MILEEAGLVSYYNFGAGAGSKLWDQKGTNHGDITGATWTQKSNGIYTLDFDGVADYVITSGGVSGITGDFTFAGWVNPRQNDDDALRGMFGNLDHAPADGVCLSQYNQEIRVYWGGGSDYYEWTSKLTTINIWYYLVLQYTSNTFYLYINGILQSGTRIQVISQNDTDILVGRWSVIFGSYCFDGLINEVAIYNVALSPETILQHYTVGVWEGLAVT